MSKIESLSDLFELVGCQATFYDIGRHITKMTTTQVREFDQKQQPYPLPFKQQAWLAIVLTPSISSPAISNSTSSTTTDSFHEKVEPIIWFIRLAIDEQGCLNLGTRDHLLKTIVDKILNDDSQSDLGDALKDNPYAFQPDHERMASFHATLSLAFDHTPSSYFAELIDFLQKTVGQTTDTDARINDEAWQSLGLQGIADLAVRSHQQKYSSLIQQAILQAPIPLACALATALEHETPSPEYLAFVETIFTQIKNNQMQAALIRSVSKGTPSAKFMAAIKQVISLEEQAGTDEALHIIVAIVAKCPNWLNKDEVLLSLCMENLAQRQDGYLAFGQIASELSQMPTMRNNLWQLFRSEKRSQKLSQAIGSLFTQAPSQVQ